MRDIAIVSFSSWRLASLSSVFGHCCPVRRATQLRAEKDAIRTWSGKGRMSGASRASINSASS